MTGGLPSGPGQSSGGTPSYPLGGVFGSAVAGFGSPRVPSASSTTPAGSCLFSVIYPQVRRRQSHEAFVLDNPETGITSPMEQSPVLERSVIVVKNRLSSLRESLMTKSTEIFLAKSHRMNFFDGNPVVFLECILPAFVGIGLFPCRDASTNLFLVLAVVS